MGDVEKATLAMRGFTKSQYGLRKVCKTLKSSPKYIEGVFVILKQVTNQTQQKEVDFLEAFFPCCPHH